MDEFGPSARLLLAANVVKPTIRASRTIPKISTAPGGSPRNDPLIAPRYNPRQFPAPPPGAKQAKAGGRDVRYAMRRVLSAFPIALIAVQPAFVARPGRALTGQGATAHHARQSAGPLRTRSAFYMQY
jgi:hypothetical protein